jgi:dipeptidyl aminopeptidase/acylaminoacyl peptidase
LAGHSFGGYETNYILTRTDIFAAAVSGASIADPISSYLSYSPSTGLMDYWRYEDHQFRIGKPLYEDTAKYLSNSPVLHAANISTPLLTWAGKDDPIVRPAQSLQMYAALRRLGRRHVMLLYPGEGHTLNNKENQADLTTRIQDWFNHFLKDEPAQWIDME